MKIGVTATQNGLTEAQVRTAERLLGSATEFHHGECVGGDEELHNICRAIAPDATIVSHPPTDPSKRAFHVVPDLTREPKPYRERNTDIVNETDCLIAFSGIPFEIVRSGTWMTVRIARKALAKGDKINIIIVWPDGSTSPGNDPRLTSREHRMHR